MQTTCALLQVLMSQLDLELDRTCSGDGVLNIESSK